MSDESKPQESLEKMAQTPAPQGRSYRVGPGPVYLGGACLLTAGATVRRRREDLEGLGARVLEALIAQGAVTELK